MGNPGKLPTIWGGYLATDDFDKTLKQDYTYTSSIPIPDFDHPESVYK